MITLTEKAIQKIIEIAESESIAHATVRVKILGGGCSGFTQDMTFDDQITDMDEVFDIGKVKIICDSLSFQYLQDTTIDWVDNVMSSGFKFLNPNVKGSCGCGNSVEF